MAKKVVQEGVSAVDKKKFAKYLAEDEELVLASGYGKTFVRHRFVYYIMLPGIIFILAGVAWAYFVSRDLSPDVFQQKLGIGLLGGLVASCIFALFKAMWLYHGHRYLLTTRRVIIKQGVLAVKITSALYDKITHIEVDQSFMDRLVMHHGNIIINTAGGNSDELRLNYVDSPLEFKNLLERLINREREHYGRQATPLVAMEGEVVD